MIASPWLMSRVASRAMSPPDAVTATPTSDRTKPRICTGPTRMPNSRKLATKMTSGMPDCSIVTLMAEVYFSAE